MLRIKGFQTLTLLDYPGQLAATIFTEGCNFRCPFCHNASLVTGDTSDVYYAPERVLAHLKNRKGRLTGLCVSGGEPLLQPELADFLRQVKALGFQVKLDTNGSTPEVLEALIREDLIDSVAMDIKNAPYRYAETAGLPPEQEKDILRRVEASIRLLRNIGVNVEFRTTLVREFHRPGDILALGRWLAGDEPYYLQTFVDSGDVIAAGLSGFSPEETEEFCRAIRPFLPKATLRGA
ncbi:MAG: anaerobic ribonucleoside-triphosphate reductase activating protein [Eubacteriales bacterium]|jgi:pyruvate formate lyase activating enzyme|nr:anaerobic ribonucleoside-triphosphate reductase activating protein [Eubacteriales bacterium]